MDLNVYILSDALTSAACDSGTLEGMNVAEARVTSVEYLSFRAIKNLRKFFCFSDGS
jgi:hypothetical protein